MLPMEPQGSGPGLPVPVRMKYRIQSGRASGIKLTEGPKIRS